MTAKLILSMDGMLIQEYPLSKERMTIGRKAGNDIVINNLAVSSQHAAIITILHDSFMEDLDSTNGLSVNGVPAKKHFLQNNDVIEIGKYKLKYVNEHVSQTNADDFEKTMILRAPVAQFNTYAEGSGDTGHFPSMQAVEPKVTVATYASTDASTDASTEASTEASTDASTEASSDASTEASIDASTEASPEESRQAAVEVTLAQVAAAPALAAIQILNGPNAGKELDLVKGLTTLGKPGVQVVVLTRRPQGFFITHVEGASFPSVNGKVLGAQPCQLSDHDLIELAGIKMEFYFK